MKFLHIFAFLLCVSVGHCLKCNYCASTSSWDDCKTQEVTCDKLYDRCVKAYAKYKLRGDTYTDYAKFCGTDSMCNAAKSTTFCKSKADCKFTCCSGDLCNTAAMQVVSVVVLVLCAFLASVMIQ